MSYLSQMAGLAVQNFVSAAVGMAVLAAVVRGIARRTTTELGNFWRDLYRSLVYILLPLALVLGRRSSSRRASSRRSAATRPRRRSRARTRRSRAARSRSQIAIKQLGTNGGGFYNSNSAVPFENPNGLSNFLEVLAILLIPAAQVFMFGKMVGARRQALVVFAAMFAMFAIGVAVVLPAEQHGSRGAAQLGREHHAGERPERRQHVRQGGPLRDRQLGALDGADDRRLERLGQQRPRRVHTRRRRRPAREHLRRRGDLRRRRLRASTGCSSTSSSPSSSPG